MPSRKSHCVHPVSLLVTPELNAIAITHLNSNRTGILYNNTYNSGQGNIMSLITEEIMMGTKGNKTTCTSFRHYSIYRKVLFVCPIQRWWHYCVCRNSSSLSREQHLCILWDGIADEDGLMLVFSSHWCFQGIPPVLKDRIFLFNHCNSNQKWKVSTYTTCSNLRKDSNRTFMLHRAPSIYACVRPYVNVTLSYSVNLPKFPYLSYEQHEQGTFRSWWISQQKWITVRR